MTDWKTHRKNIEIMIANGVRGANAPELAPRQREQSAAWARSLLFFLTDYDRIDTRMRAMSAELETLRERSKSCACNAFARTVVARGAAFDEALHCKTCRGTGEWSRDDVTVTTCPDCKGDGSR